MISTMIGIVLFIVGLMGLIRWWDFFIQVFLGMIPISLLIVGVIAVIAGVTSIMDNAAARRDASKIDTNNE